MAPAIQVAFQGGGARFVEMLPAAHALADAHRDHIVRLNRVAGSSAGSICASLIAADADFNRARTFMLTHGLPRARAMQRWSTRLADGSKVVNWLRVGGMLWHGYRGKSLYKTEILVSFLSDLFANATGSGAPTIDQINARADGIKLAITGSDLSRSQGALFESGNLIESVANSCAIPFALRSFTEVRTSPYVDGGVCENLPVERLLNAEDNDGPIFCVAISDVEPQPYLPGNAWQYLMQLISASMNHNVERAKRLVGFSNVIEIKTELTTFDFEGAIHKLGDDTYYRKVYGATRDRLQRFAQLYQSIPVQSSANISGRVSAPKIMRSLHRVFETSLGMPEWSYKRAAFVVRADGLQAFHNGTPAADHLVRIAEIEAKGDNLVCFSSSAPRDAGGSIVPTSWACFNQTQNRDLAVQAVPVDNPTDLSGNGMVGILVFFENPRASIAQGDRIIVTSHYLIDGGMKGLETGGQDYIATANPHPIPIETVDIVLVYPGNFGTVSPSHDTRYGERAFAFMQNQQLRQQYGSVASTGYNFAGLSTQNLLPGQHFRANFNKDRA